MKNNNVINISNQVRDYCAQISADPLWVQGAGGNVSWKEGKTLWIKASGTWLKDSSKENIFVPLDLQYLQDNIEKNNFFVKPKLINESKLRPSIETMLHAILKFKIVIHLHPVDVLSHLIRYNWIEELENKISKNITWIPINYYKPGEELANEINKKLRNIPQPNVIFLQNHGIIVGHETIENIDLILKKIISNLKKIPIKTNYNIEKMIKIDNNLNGYELIDDLEVQNLVKNPILFDLLNEKWAICPDHVVFLGRSPCVYSNKNQIEGIDNNNIQLPKLIFIKNTGVFIKKNSPISLKIQLRFFYDVLIRQDNFADINTLTKIQVIELLNWESEIYRQINTL